ncbi:hypothetical protein Agub_g13712, partial [Astrephomene gubernaculifera]
LVRSRQVEAATQAATVAAAAAQQPQPQPCNVGGDGKEGPALASASAPPPPPPAVSLPCCMSPAARRRQLEAYEAECTAIRIRRLAARWEEVQLRSRGPSRQANRRSRGASGRHAALVVSPPPADSPASAMQGAGAGEEEGQEATAAAEAEAEAAGVTRASAALPALDEGDGEEAVQEGDQSAAVEEHRPTPACPTLSKRRTRDDAEVDASCGTRSDSDGSGSGEGGAGAAKRCRMSVVDRASCGREPSPTNALSPTEAAATSAAVGEADAEAVEEERGSAAAEAAAAAADAMEAEGPGGGSRPVRCRGNPSASVQAVAEADSLFPPPPPPLPYSVKALAALAGKPLPPPGPADPGVSGGDVVSLSVPSSASLAHRADLSYGDATLACRTQAALADLYGILADVDLLSVQRDTYPTVTGACPVRYQAAFTCVRPMQLGTNIALEPPVRALCSAVQQHNGTLSYGNVRTPWVLADAIREQEDLPGPLLALLAAEAECQAAGVDSGEPGGPMGQWAASEVAAGATRLAQAAVTALNVQQLSLPVQQQQQQQQQHPHQSPMPSPWLLSSLRGALLDVSPHCATGGTEATLERLAA